MYNETRLHQLSATDDHSFSLWHYRTRDRLTEVEMAGYFPVTAPMMPGDFLLINAGWGTSEQDHASAVVVNGDAGVQIRVMKDVALA